MSNQPHIILLMADHLRRDCLSCYGDVPVATPHLDELAEQSVIFNRMYCASPLCMPTRTAMQTGKWPHTTGAMVNGHAFEAEYPYSLVGAQHGTLYESLDKAGYGISHVGVHHLHIEPPMEKRVPRAKFSGYREWEEYSRQNKISPNRQTAAQSVPNVEWCEGRPVMKMRPQARRTRFPHDAEHFMDVFWSRLAEERIAQLDWSQPQYLETLFWAPHPPLEVPEPFYNMYPPESIELPETVGRWYPGQPATLLMQSCGQMGAGRTREEYREGWSAYLGLVTLVDECIGRVIAALKNVGVWDDALVIFTQDHGDMLGCHHLTQKHCCYQEATHLPLLIKPPVGEDISIPASRREQWVSALDYCPTICDYSGATLPSGVQGISWRPAIQNANASGRDATFIEYNGDQGRTPWPMRAIVSEIEGTQYKYIYTVGDVDELYDLTRDPLETTSMVADAEYSLLRENLRHRLATWMAETGDFLRLPVD